VNDSHYQGLRGKCLLASQSQNPKPKPYTLSLALVTSHQLTQRGRPGVVPCLQKWLLHVVVARCTLFTWSFRSMRGVPNFVGDEGLCHPVRSSAG